MAAAEIRASISRNMSRIAALTMRHSHMVPAIAMMRCRSAAAKLGRNFVDVAEWPVTARLIELEQRARPHREAVVDWWRWWRQHDPYSQGSGAPPSLARIGIFGVLTFQQAFLEQPLGLSAYGGARAVQAICDLCSRARRPQGDKFADFLGGPSGHGGPRRSGHPAPGAMTADSCGTILSIASFPRRRRVSSVQLNRVTLPVRVPRASTHPIPEIHWPRSTG